MRRLFLVILTAFLHGGIPAAATSPPSHRSLDLLSELAAQAPLPSADMAPELPDEIRQLVQRCFQALVEREGRSGRIELEIHAIDGTVSNVSIQKNETQDPLVETCILEAVKEKTLESHPEQPFTWVFTQGEG